MTNLNLTDEETIALERELRSIVDYDRYQFSPHIRTLREIPNKIRPPAPKTGAAAANETL